MSIDKKTLERIQKLLAMTESPNKNEANIAQRRVDAMLKELSLTEEDILGIGQYKKVFYITKDRSTPSWKIQMYTQIAFILGCSLTYRRNCRDLCILGRGGRPDIVYYVFSVVERNMIAAWNQFRKEYKAANNVSPKGKVRDTWYKYFSYGVMQKAYDIYANLDEESQKEVQADFKEAQEKEADDVRTVRSRQPSQDTDIDYSVARSGYRSGIEQNLNIGLQNSFADQIS